VKILLDNVNLGSTSGPNHFGKKLKTKLIKMGHECSLETPSPDVQLSFIETHMATPVAPMVLRLDGIYFDTDSDFVAKNKNILRSYRAAAGIIFQSEFSKELIFKFFGEHTNYDVIHNGADIEYINTIPVMDNELTNKYDNVWSCASSWYYSDNPKAPRVFKRLQQNIEFFQQYGGPNDCLVIAGFVPREHAVDDHRVIYAGRLNIEQLFSLYKTSKYFIHLSSPDSCPNVVVDARASGCKIVCSSVGGTREVAGPDAIIVEETPWDYEPMRLNGIRRLDLTNISSNCYNAEVDIHETACKYESFMESLLGF